MTRRTLAALAACALLLAGCGTASGSTTIQDGNGSSAGAGASTPADPSTGCVTLPSTPNAGGVTVTGAPGTAPTIKLGPDTQSTTDLTVEDLVVGTGAAAGCDSTVQVQYVGVGAQSGDTFDSSWSRHAPITFPLANVIEGWQKGIPGMKVGGRRLLVIPAAMAYGDTPPDGSGIAAGETLVFVVDLLAVQ